MEQAPSVAHLFLGISLEVWGTWLAALLTLAIFSFLYADNPVYKAAEHLFVGVSAAYGVVILFFESVKPDIYLPLFKPGEVDLEAPKLILLIPIAFGLMLLTRFIPRIDYLSRWPIAVTMGAYAGMGIPLSLQGNIFKQMEGTMKPLLPVAADQYAASDAINAFLILLGVVCTLSYFYFSLEHKGVLKVTSKIGIWFLMIAFGAGFGNTVMARISLLIGRVQFILDDVLPTLKPPFLPPH
jgi:hypothetical protein